MNNIKSKRTKSFRLKAISVACMLASSGLAMHQALAQEQANEFLEEVIVTGTAGGATLDKVDASFSITTANAEQIEKFSPKSTADLFKIIPGIWAESSGGVSGANVFVRGFPGGGDAPYVTVQLNGAPIFPPPSLSFLENSTLFRLDETIERMEALRGGSNPVLSNGQPGLTTNFLLRKGSPESEGRIKFSTSDYNLKRLDGYASGEISEDFYYMIGGYISSSPGVRDAGFNSEEGQQFTISLDKTFENGSWNLYHRRTDDHGTWYLPSALNTPNSSNAEYLQLGSLNRQVDIMTSDGNTRSIDLGEGRGWNGSVTGGKFEIDFAEGWTLVDRFSHTSGDADTLGLVPNGGAVLAGSMGSSLTGRLSGRAIAPTEYIQQFGAWEVRKDIDSFTNDLSITKSTDVVDLTVGYYTATSSTDEFWSLGNQKYYVVEQGGEMISGIACNEPTVDSCGWNYDIDATGDTRTNALYGLATFNIADTVSIDLGLRNEKHEVDYSVDEGLTGKPSKTVQYDESGTSGTLAVNVAIGDNMGIFARANKGKVMPYFDAFRDQYGAYSGGNNLIQDIEQFEVGYKMATDNMSLYTTLFKTEVDPSVFVALTGVSTADVSTNESTGVEIDSNIGAGVFNLNLNATVMDSEIKSGENSGKEAQRQPGWQVRLTPSVDLDMGWGGLSLYGTLSAVDDRFGDNANTVVLPGYEKVDLGAVVRVDDLSFQLAVDNAFDEDGITEGDPRNPDAPNGRYILPRSITFSVGYDF